MNSVVEFAPPAGKEKKLLDQMRDVLRFKHYSLRTEQTYCHWVERFIRFHKLKRDPFDEAADSLRLGLLGRLP